MCQMTMKFPAMFDENPPHTIDKIVKKLTTTKNAQSLTSSPNIKNQRIMT